MLSLSEPPFTLEERTMPAVYVVYHNSGFTPTPAEVVAAMRRLRCSQSLAIRLCRMLHAMRTVSQ
jgi:hypothetical protein